MTNRAVADTPQPPDANLSITDFDGLAIPPLDPAFVSEDLAFTDHERNISSLLSFDEDDIGGDFDFDFTFDDLYLPPDTGGFFNPAVLDKPSSLLVQIDSSCTVDLTEPELCQNSASPDLFAVSDDQLSGTRVLDSRSPESIQVSGDGGSGVLGYLNIESGGIDKESSEETDTKGSPSCYGEPSGPASSQGSGSGRSNVSESLNCPSPDSNNVVQYVNSSPNFAYDSIPGDVDQKIKLEEVGNNSVLKRKKEHEDVNQESRTTKFRRSGAIENAISEEDEKRKARLMRNRESAQLSRQRKKHYVEELEDKVRAMHSTIQDLNAKISYIMAENASLRQQMGGGVCPPPVPPGMYQHPPVAPMAYPWMPCPPYVMKSQGSQVPLVPIPRLKPQQRSATQKVRKVDSKKTEGKTKKVASVSFLGFLFFILLFGGLVPMVNVKYGRLQDTIAGGLDYNRERALTVESHLNGTDGMNKKFGCGNDFRENLQYGRGRNRESESTIGQKGGSNAEFVHLDNYSEPLVASLYVPRNDKLVKIDGNLIIHSVLASEQAMASRRVPREKGVKETGLAIKGNFPPAVPYPGNGRNPRIYGSQVERRKAIASSSAEDKLKSTAADGKVQEWFLEGLAGPMLSSGMCTEVFQFDVSPTSASGAIIPAPEVRNVSTERRQNSTNLNKGINRRILHGLPIPLPATTQNMSTKYIGTTSNEEKFCGNNSASSMVVSVLIDPREAGDGDGDSVIRSKSLSRIFVVVLLDSVKYVTYSCVLPLKGSSGHHLVTN